MSKEKQIEEIQNIIYLSTDIQRDFSKLIASKIYNSGYRKQSEVIKKFVRRFESYIGNCTFTLGQTNDILYALKMATEEMEGGAE